MNASIQRQRSVLWKEKKDVAHARLLYGVQTYGILPVLHIVFYPCEKRRG